MILVRDYQQSDYYSLQEILKQADMFDEVWDSQENFASMIAINPLAIQVAQVDDEIVGLIIIDSHGKETSFFYRLAVSEQKRGSGIGSALLQRAEEIAKNMGAKEVAIYVDSENTIVQRFYTMKGYKTSGKKFICMYKTI